jgi:P-type Ca2+ transporter type 2C
MELPGIPHARPVEEIQEQLSTSPSGLAEAEAAKRLFVYGKNTLTEEKTSRFVIFLRQFRSLLIYILIIAAIISLFVADIKDFLVISLLILVNSSIGFWQELKAEASLDALKKLTASRVRVTRDGAEHVIPSEELVPGDCVVLSEGDLVTADIRLFEGFSLTVDESSLTGESLPVVKDPAAVVP